MPISSMTAFACSQGNDPGSPVCDWTWEIRSLNAKGLDVRLRLPSGFDSLEFAIRERVRRYCKRGTIALTLTVTRTEAQNMVHVNEDLLTRLLTITSEWYRRYPDQIRPPQLDGLLALPGVLVPVGDGENGEKLKAQHEALVLQSLEQALDSLVTMRMEEGRQLSIVLATHLDTIATLTERAHRHATAQFEIIRDRLRSLVVSLLDTSPALPEGRLDQEVVLLVAKADVREELDRLHAYILAARQLLVVGSVVGRRLDFLCQELNREANTLCAKAASIDLTHIGFDLRITVDQLREQVQNIE